MNEYYIEYEIPPMRAIYFAHVDAQSEDGIRRYLEKCTPRWHIRKIVQSEFPTNQPKLKIYDDGRTAYGGVEAKPAGSGGAEGEGATKEGVL